MNEQECSFDFLLSLLEISHQKMRELFLIESITTSRCKNCFTEKVLTNVNELSINLSLPEKSKQIDFNHLLQFSLNSEIDEYSCENCNCKKHTTSQSLRSTPNLKYIIIKISISTNDQTGITRNNCKIKNFNPEDIRIANFNENCSFKLKSAICHLTADEKKDGSAGHYVVWSRSLCNSGWIRISDDSGKFYQKLIGDLKNVTMLMCERI